MSTQSGDMLRHYRLGERLGEGGMGVVFKALDTRLNRTVAVKILAPEFTADLERRLRFQREAQTAAALNHPGIATIHEVGEERDTDFIVMEMIEGRTLRDLIRERPLPVKEWLRVSSSLAEGVGYAHRRGVLHRDLKPENIMLTPDGQVKILDFGLAKLLEAPAAEGDAHRLHSDLETISRELTLSGKVYGTVPYMSPEQVRGEPADHRSDLFSLGVILYEMASGKSPFRAKTEIETLHGILNVDPPPLTSVAPEFPLEADRIIRKAIEKERDRRYQDAADLVADLRNLSRDYDTGRTSTRQSVLAGAGLRDDGTGHHATRWFRRPAVLVPAVLLVGMGVFAGARAFFSNGSNGPRNVPAPPSPPVPGENSLAVMYFENVPDPADADRLGQMITSLLITDLSESQALRVVSRQRLYDTLRLLGKSDSRVIDATVASEVAERAGARWILTGSILQTQPGLVLTADVSEAGSGHVLASQRVDGNPGESLFAAVDRLSAEIKRDLATEKGTPAGQDRPVSDVTTNSPEAYRAYLDGLDAAYKLYSQEAERHFIRAVEIDSTFAMAHYMLATLSNGTEQAKALAAAGRHANHASDRERRFIRALALEVEGKTDEAVRELEATLDRYPDDKETMLRLCRIYGSRRERDKEIPILHRIIAIDPLEKLAYNALSYAYNDLGDLEHSLEAIDKYISLAPDEANPYDTRGDLYVSHGHIPEAMTSYREALKRNPDFVASRLKLAELHLNRREYASADSLFRDLAAGESRWARATARYGLALIPTFQGKLERAEQLLDQGIAADKLEKEEAGQLPKLALQVSVHMTRRDFALARRSAEEFAQTYGNVDPEHAASGKGLLVWVLVASGATDEAERLFHEIDRQVPRDRADLTQTRDLAESAIAAARGDTTRSLDALRKIGEKPNSVVSFWVGFGYLNLGRIEEAVRHLERCLTTYDDERRALGPSLVLCHYYLGSAYEQSGWKQKAAAEYREFLAFWGDGDPGIEEVEDARKRLALVGGGT